MALFDFLRGLFTSDPNSPTTQDELREFLTSTGDRISSGSYNIERFKNQNLIRSAKFAMRFLSIPNFVTTESEDLRKLILLCDSVEFPGQTLTTTDYTIPGRLKIKAPYLRDLTEVNCTFYISDEMPVYGFFNEWIYQISSNSIQNRYYDEIVGTAEIIQFEDTTNSYFISSATANKNMTVRLKNIYPLNVQNMPSNWMDDGFHKVSVGFCFEDLEIVTRV
jgi:hypothetical protein